MSVKLILDFLTQRSILTGFDQVLTFNILRNIHIMQVTQHLYASHPQRLNKSQNQISGNSTSHQATSEHKYDYETPSQ